MLPQNLSALLGVAFGVALALGGCILFVLLAAAGRRGRIAASPEFPAVADLADTCLRDHARDLLALLSAEVKAERASVYRAAYGHEWNVWLPSSVVPGGQRLTLHDWCVERGIPALQRQTLAGGAVA